MFNSMLMPLFLVFLSAIAIHLGTRFFIGPRADGLPGGAIGAAFIQSLPILRSQDAQTACIFAVLMLAAALAGHFLSQRVVSSQFPDFGKKVKDTSSKQ